MEPLQIYYRVLGGLLVFVLVFWALYRSKPKLEKLKKYTDPESIKDWQTETLEKQNRFFRKHEKTTDVFFGTFFQGILFFAGFFLYNIHVKSEFFSFSVIQIIGLLLAMTLGGCHSSFIKDKSSKSNITDLGTCFLVAAFLLPCGLELSRTSNPHIFGSPIPKLLSFLFAAVIIGIGVKVMFEGIKKITQPSAYRAEINP
ncbi:MAG: hypothetical protein KAS94_00555, partial [Desulfobulbaceae bacterium]|nr:hypothetical protein [Desulfobulbaceae bacterium]